MAEFDSDPILTILQMEAVKFLELKQVIAMVGAAAYQLGNTSSRTITEVKQH